MEQERSELEAGFFNEFVPSAEQFLKLLNLPKKAIHFIDNVSSHPNEDKLSIGDIRVVLQPVGHGMLKTLKKNISVYVYCAH